LVRLSCPAKPSEHYGEEFISMEDYLSILRIQKKKQLVIHGDQIYESYENVLKFIVENKITTQKDWFEIKKPKGIPDKLNIYKNYGFRSYSYLFKGTKERQTKFTSFERACEIVRSAGIKSQREYSEKIKSGELPSMLPSSPHVVYISEGWQGWNHFLDNKREMPSWEEFKSFVTENGIKTFKDYITFRQNNPSITLPASPAHSYKEFISYAELFGGGSRFSSMSNEKAIKLINDIENKLGTSLSEFSHAEIISILKSFPEGRALLLANYTLDKLITLIKVNISHSWRLSEQGGEGRKDILYKLLHDRHDAYNEETQEGRELTDLLIRKAINDEKFYREIKELDSSSPYVVAIKKELVAIEKVPSLNADQMKNLGIKNLTISQRYFARKLNSQPFLGNWSSPGTGKTLAALYGVYLQNKKRVLIMAGLSTFAQWEKSITGIYAGSASIDWNNFETELEEGKVQFNLVNYEKFISFKRSDRLSVLGDHKYDAIILDESHLVKKSIDNLSFKRESFIKLLNLYRNKKGFHFVMLSATPFINNLSEALSCLQLLDPEISLSRITNTGVLYDYHKHFQRLGVRFHANFDINVEVHEEKMRLPLNQYQKLTGQANSILGLERVLAKRKIPIINNHLKPGVIIYTHYVTGITSPLKKFLQDQNFSVAIHTGDEKVGLKSFLRGETDILICSRALLYGFDGLQKRVNTIIVLSPMWTSTEYDQLLGRIHRRGSAFTRVKMIIPMIQGENDSSPSWDELRWERIKAKRSLLESVLDGNFPDKLQIDKEKLYKQFKESIQTN
jgi:superfamily II DNA or RNA helicase